MKKSLLSLLAVAVAAVGCQNYDDQFDDLNSQIAALSSQVAGLAQVQSDLASLAGTVSSLQSAVNSTATAIEGLDGLADAVAEIQASVDGVATQEDLTDITNSITEQEAALEELLQNSSVFQGDVVINSPATLDAFHAMGSTLNIVNGYVDIDVDTDMDMVKVQEVIDNILVTTEQFDVQSTTDVETELTFNNLTGTQTLTLKNYGGYVVPNLESATVVTLTDANSVDIVDLRSLASVTSINSGSIHFDKATELHLTSLPRYGATLSLKVKKGGVIAMDALRDVDVDGEQSALALTVEGPASLTIGDLDGTDGSITLTEVATAAINGYNGSITLKDGVENFSADHVVTISTASATDLVSFDITGALDADEDADDEEGPAIDLDGHSDLETVSLSGVLASVTIENNGNLTDVTIDADVSGSAGVKIASNSDLTDITLTGSKMAKLQVTSNGDLEALTVDTTWRAYHESEDGINGNLTVTSNESLLSLTVSSNNIEDLNVSSNSDLETLDFTGVDAIGAEGEASVTISGNNLTASKVDAKAESITSDSGMATLKDYLDAVAADADSSASVLFDEVDDYVDEDGDSQGTKTSGDGVIVLSLSAAVPAKYSGQVAAVTEKRAWSIPATAGIGLDLTVDSVSLLHDGSNYGLVTTTGNLNVDLTNIKSALALSRATTVGVTLDVYKKGDNAAPSIEFLSTIDSATGNNGEAYSNAAVGALSAGTVSSFLTTYDKVTLAIGNLSITTTLTAASSQAAADAHGLIAAKLITEWNAKYGTAGTSSALSTWGDLSAGGGGTTGTIRIASKGSQTGSRGWNDLIAVTLAKTTAGNVSIATSGAVTKTSEIVLDWVIGDTEATDDNNATAQALIIQLAEGDQGISSPSQATLTFTTAGPIELATTQRFNTNNGAGTETTTTSNIYPTDARLDVQAGESGDEGVETAAAVAAVSVDNTAWL